MCVRNLNELDNDDPLNGGGQAFILMSDHIGLDSAIALI